MAQSQSIKTDLPFLSFPSVFTRIQHAPVPAAFQGSVEFGAGPLKERGRGDEEDKIHPHLLVVAPERPAVDKLLAKEVLVPDIKAAEDMDFGPFTTTPIADGDKVAQSPCSRQLPYDSVRLTSTLEYINN